MTSSFTHHAVAPRPMGLAALGRASWGQLSEANGQIANGGSATGVIRMS
jgi:hypothetical protein